MNVTKPMSKEETRAAVDLVLADVVRMRIAVQNLEQEAIDISDRFCQIFGLRGAWNHPNINTRRRLCFCNDLNTIGGDLIELEDFLAGEDCLSTEKIGDGDDGDERVIAERARKAREEHRAQPALRIVEGGAA